MGTESLIFIHRAKTDVIALREDCENYVEEKLGGCECDEETIGEIIVALVQMEKQPSN